MKIIYVAIIALMTFSCKNMVEQAVADTFNEIINSGEVGEPEEWDAFYSTFQEAIKTNDTYFLEGRSYPSSTYEANLKIIKEIQGDESLLNYFTETAKGKKLDKSDPYFTDVEAVENYHYVEYEGGREFLRLTFGQIYGAFVLVDAQWFK